MDLALRISGFACLAVGACAYIYSQWLWGDVGDHSLSSKPKWLPKSLLIYFPQHLSAEGRKLSSITYRWMLICLVFFVIGFGLLYLGSR